MYIFDGSAGKSNIVIGAFYCLVAILGSVTIYSTQPGFGGTATIALGSFLTGAYYLAKGMIQLDKIRQGRDREEFLLENQPEPESVDSHDGPASGDRIDWRQVLVSIWLGLIALALIWMGINRG